MVKSVIDKIHLTNSKYHDELILPINKCTADVFMLFCSGGHVRSGKQGLQSAHSDLRGSSGIQEACGAARKTARGVR